MELRVRDLKFLSKERNAHEFPLCEIGLLSVIKLNQHVAAILIQNFNLLHISIVTEQMEKIRYLLLVVLSLRQVLNHEHPREVVLRLLFVVVTALSRVPAIPAVVVALRVTLLLVSMELLFNDLISIVGLLGLLTLHVWFSIETLIAFNELAGRPAVRASCSLWMYILRVIVFREN